MIVHGRGLGPGVNLNTGRGSSSLYEKLTWLLRGEKIRYCEAAGDVKLTGDSDKQSLSVQECFFWLFFIKSLVLRGVNLSNAVMLLSAALEERKAFKVELLTPGGLRPKRTVCLLTPVQLVPPTKAPDIETKVLNSMLFLSLYWQGQ